MDVQSWVLRRCASTSSSGFPANSGLKWDQFNCGTGSGWTGYEGRTGCVGGAGGCTGGTGGTTEGITGDGWGAGGPLSAISIYVGDGVTKIIFNSIPNSKQIS